MSNKLDILTNLFVESSYREFNLREIARLTGLNPMTASKYLGRLEKEGVIRKKPERNYIFYSANTESITFRDLKKYHNVRKLRSSGLVDYIEKELGYPQAIVLFGSYSKAENNRESDIDLFILSESKKKLDLSGYMSKLGAEIQIFRHSRIEFEEMKAKNKELLNNILNGTVLNGFLEVFK
jgi:predicted nucleotidyltransferase